MKSKIKKMVTEFEEMISVLEKNEIHKNIINEIPKEIINLYPMKARQKYKAIYSDMRLNGNTINKSLDLSGRMIARNYRNDVSPLLLEIGKALQKVKEKFYVEDIEEDGVEESCGNTLHEQGKENLDRLSV